MSYVGKITSGGSTHLVGSTLYGTCTTAADTAAKVVTCADFDQLMEGITIHVKFTNSNSATNPTLNVNNTGAKNIYKYGTAAPGTTAATSWSAGSVISFTYDGSYWQMNDHIDDTDSDTKVRQALISDNTNRPLLLAYSNNTTTTTNVDNVVGRNNSIYANPSTGTITAPIFSGDVYINSDLYTNAFLLTANKKIIHTETDTDGNRFMRVGNDDLDELMLEDGSGAYTLQDIISDLNNSMKKTNFSLSGTTLTITTS